MAVKPVGAADLYGITDEDQPAIDKVTEHINTVITAAWLRHHRNCELTFGQIHREVGEGATDRIIGYVLTTYRLPIDAIDGGRDTTITITLPPRPKHGLANPVLHD